MAQEYKNFAAQYGFKLTTSSPYQPKGHGFIERQVQPIKKILIKCELDGTSPHMVMLELRTTPLGDNTPSPAELLGNRRYKTTLPAITRASYNSEAVWQNLLKRQEYAGHDAHAKELPRLLPQQPIWLQEAPNTSHWQPATVISTPGESTPRSYVVSIKDGAKYWHNRLMLQQRVIPDEELKVPPKASSVNVGAPRIQAPQLSKSDSLQAQIPLSTNNNKGSSPKPTQDLVHAKDEEGIEKERPKRTMVKPIRYRDVNSITNNIFV